MCQTILYMYIFCSLFELNQLRLWVCVICWFCDIVYCALSSFAISSLRKKKLVVYFNCVLAFMHAFSIVFWNDMYQYKTVN